MTWRMCTTVLLLVAALQGSPALARQSTVYKGMLLTEALREMQMRGLRIVFSSAVVLPDLRVSVEPRATTARRQLEELLAPHGLMIREGPGRTLQVVRSSVSAPPRREARGSIEGRVIDAGTGTPVSRAVVQVEGHRIDAHTDTAGQFTLAGVATGSRFVTASAEGYVPNRRAVVVDDGAPAAVLMDLSPETRRYREFISVTDAAPPRKDRGVASELSLDRSDFAGSYGSLADDPLRAVHSFPGVTPLDDFQSDLVVRASPFRHMDLVIDGVSTSWLRHTAFGRGATGSLMMMSGLVVDSATLRSGAYPRRHGDRLGPELDLSLRQGSRTDFAMSGAIGGAHAVLAAEGPLGGVGAAGSARGSWLVSARQSYLEWPPERSASSRTPFGFSDGLAKVVFDVAPTQQFALTALGGITSIDEDEDNLAPGELAGGLSQASAVNVSWRSTFAPAFLVTQQASAVMQRYSNADERGESSDRGANEALAYRVAMSRPMYGGILEAGGQLERTATRRRSRLPDVTPIEGASWLRSGFVHVSWPVTPSLTISPGARISWSTLLQTPIVSRWLLGEWSFRPGWSLIGSAGASRQPPELVHVVGEMGSPDLRPERAAHLEVGVEHHLTRSVRWQATLFYRGEADVLRFPDVSPRRLGETLVFADPGEPPVNALRGSSRGIELLMARRSPLGVSGWASYAYGRARQTDTTRSETFWADFDQRHTVNLSARYRFSSSTGVAATFRAGSNFPIPGYFARNNGRLIAGSARNQVRLLPYARLDLRADRQFRHAGRTFTLFIEALNALNRANTGLVDGSVDTVTGEATGFTDTLLRRRVSAGIVFEF